MRGSGRGRRAVTPSNQVPGHASVLLAAPLQALEPDPPHVLPEGVERSSVVRHAEVAVVASQHTGEPGADAYDVASPGGSPPLPCGVPLSVSRHSPFSRMPASSHSRTNRRIGDPVRHHPQQPLVVDRVEDAADVGIEHPVHALAHDRCVQRRQRLFAAQRLMELEVGRASQPPIVPSCTRPTRSSASTARSSGVLGLPRIGGHRERFRVRCFCHAENPSPVPGGVPPPDGRVGPRRTRSDRPRP